MPSKNSKCVTCASSDCTKEAKLIILEMKEGIKLSVVECKKYEERKNKE
jgi:hypothetical protein